MGQDFRLIDPGRALLPGITHVIGLVVFAETQL